MLNENAELQKASERINTEAENLTARVAKKGDKKLQGNWGVALERVLEESGLRKDHEHFLQFSSRDEAGQIKRPDVLIRLPEGKDVIVDVEGDLGCLRAGFSQRRRSTARGAVASAPYGPA